MRQGTEIQLRSLRQEVQVQAQTAVASHLKSAQSGVSIIYSERNQTQTLSRDIFFSRNRIILSPKLFVRYPNFVRIDLKILLPNFRKFWASGKL